MQGLTHKKLKNQNDVELFFDIIIYIKKNYFLHILNNTRLFILVNFYTIYLIRQNYRISLFFFNLDNDKKYSLLNHNSSDKFDHFLKVTEEIGSVSDILSNKV